MMHSAKPPHIVELERIDDHLRDGRPREAELLARQFAERHPQNIDGWILLGRAQIDLVQYAAAMASANAAIALDAKHPVARSLMMNALLRNGQPDAAFEQARQLETERKFDPALMLTIGSFYTQTNRHADAARCYERVRILQPANHAVIFNLTSAHIALGNLDKAEALFDELLRKDPQNFNAYYPRSTVRKQTAQSNHVAEMEAMLRQVSSSGEAEPILCYSLAKELEDLGEFGARLPLSQARRQIAPSRDGLPGRARHRHA